MHVFIFTQAALFHPSKLGELLLNAEYTVWVHVIGL